MSYKEVGGDYLFDYHLDFRLNPHQEKASNKVLHAIEKKRSCLIDAVCGAGKTEIVLEVIKLYLNQGKTVGFACPRKTLLCDLYERVSSYFKSDAFGLVYGGCSINAQGQFIFLTTHQLSKYKGYFDLLIIDEIDAFPYLDNYQLEKSATLASKLFIYISATVPDKYYQMDIDIIKVYHRHHQQVMPLPQVIALHKGRMFYQLLKTLLFNQDKYVLYVPSKKLGLQLVKLLKVCRIKAFFISSENASLENIALLKEGKISVLVSTTVLERGITLKSLNVIVYQACHHVFNKSVLIQICGRVGRDAVVTDGQILFLCYKENDQIKECCKDLKEINEKINSHLV